MSTQNNTFVHAGCVDGARAQTRGDHGGIGFMCPNGHRADGILKDNVFTTCPGVDAMFDNMPGCHSNWTMINNQVDTMQVVDSPRINLLPTRAKAQLLPLTAEVLQPNATLRYTTDGSRPNAGSPVLPPGGILVPWPGPSFAVNVKAFHPGMRPSCTNGILLEMNHNYPLPGHGTGVRGAFDTVAVSPSAVITRGWAVDPTYTTKALPKQGWPPVTVAMLVDSKQVAVIVANVSRPDLVKAHVAPNSKHGFTLKADAEVAASLQHGNHAVEVLAVGCPGCGANGWPIGVTKCICDGKPCGC